MEQTPPCEKQHIKVVVSQSKPLTLPQPDDSATFFGLSNKKQSFDDEIECEDNLVRSSNPKISSINLSLSSI